MAGAKGIRLMKAAKEFNIGKDTLVDFLQKKGYEVVNSPNTTLTDEMYEALMLNFSDDKALKKRSEKITLSLKESEPKIKEKAVEPEKISLKKKKAVELKVTDKIELEEKPKAKKKAVAPKEDVEKEEVKPKEPKKAPARKKTEKPEVKKEEEKPAEQPEQIPPVEQQPVVEKKVESTPQAPVIEHVKIEAEKLSGPKLVGKIEIKEEPKHERKKKRKRIPTKDKKERERPVKPWQQRDRGERKNDDDKQFVDPSEIEKRLKQTLNKVQGNTKNKPPKNVRQKRKQQKAEKREFLEQEALEREAEKKLRITEFLSVSELASLMDVEVTDVISTCMSLGRMVSINQRLDAELIEIVASEFDFEVEFIDLEEQVADELVVEDKEEDLKPRAPIVTIMGHVDHGKTSLLDYIRNANVVAGEAGGITQHIGAYEVTLPSGRQITFLDTPGHEAFTAMRARGAKLTDIAVIVVAADDTVMPQTREAISHAQAAEVPMVFAINKVDKEGANPDKIREELSKLNILVEEWGGKFQSQEVSAKTGMNVDELLEKIILEADLLELKANPDRPGYGTVVEASLDKGRGFVSTILVQNGTVRIGDMLLAGPYYGRIKAMTDERGNKMESAGPSTPIQILGFSGAPQSGEKFMAYEEEDEAKRIANDREKILREQGMRTKKHITLDEIGRRIALGNFKQLNLIIKGDVDGSVEALSDSLQKLSNEEIMVNVIHQAVGQISERDVLLASASDAIICGFQVRPSQQARKLAEEEGVEIRNYSIIYDAIDEIKGAMEGMLEPKVEQKVTANIEVREVFNITGVGKVAGCFVMDGKIKRDSKVNLIRDGIVVHSGALSALKRYKDEVKEVVAGMECGISIKNLNDIHAGDTIEAFDEIQVKRTL